MTKEELEHEHIREIAENYVNESWGSYLDLDEVDLVMAGIGVGKIIASEQEKRIADLEKENAELKEHHKSVCETLTNTHRSLRDQLTKAKEIIKGWLRDFYSPKAFYGKRAELVEQSEQFLKEIEK